MGQQLGVNGGGVWSPNGTGARRRLERSLGGRLAGPTGRLAGEIYQPAKRTNLTHTQAALSAARLAARLATRLAC